MKRLKMLLNLTTEQEHAKEQLIDIERQMKMTLDDERLFDLYCEACDLWDEFFITEELMLDGVPDHERIFLARQKVLEGRKFKAAVIINGNVTINGNVVINGNK